MTPTITIHEIASTLGYKDFRSAEKYCRANNLKIFSIPNTHKKYVAKAEFEFAREKEIINYLKEKFGSEWINAYQQYSNLNLLSLVGIERKNKEDFLENHKPQVKPEQKYSLDFSSGKCIITDRMEKSFFVPENKRVRGIQVVGFCQHCKKNLTRDFCKIVKRGVKHCPHVDKQYFKAYVFPPGGGNKRKTKKLSATNLETALQQAIDFKKQVKQIGNTHIMPVAAVIANNENAGLIKEVAPREKLVDAMERYKEYLAGKHIFGLRKRERSTKHRREISRILNFFKECLMKKGWDDQITINQVDENLAHFFHSELLTTDPSPRTYDKSMGIMKTFFNFLIKKNYIAINPFKEFVMTNYTKAIPTLTKEEYKKLEDILQKPEFGICKSNDGVERNYFKPFMAPLVKLGILCGRRLEELIMLKWKDIVTSEDNKMLNLRVVDFKVSRQQNRLETDPKIISAPISKELEDFLIQQGFEKFKNSNRYIIAGDESMKRETIKSFVSKSFTHFWKQLGINKRITFKSLRATYATELASCIGLEKTRMIIGHFSKDVLSKHYVNTGAESMSKIVKDFKIFGEKNRAGELEEIRNEKVNKEQLIER